MKYPLSIACLVLAGCAAPPPTAHVVSAPVAISVAELTLAPQPFQPFHALKWGEAEKSVQLNFKTNVGWNYLVEGSDDKKHWVAVSMKEPGTGRYVGVTLHERDARRYYRLREFQ